MRRVERLMAAAKDALATVEVAKDELREAARAEGGAAVAGLAAGGIGLTGATRLHPAIRIDKLVGEE